MTRLFALTEADRAIISNLLRDYKSKNTSRGTPSADSQSDVDYRPGDILVGKFVTEASAATPTELGYALCDLFEIMGKEVFPVAAQEMVYNLSDSTIQADTLCIVQKTKGGEYIAVPPVSQGTIGIYLKNAHPGKDIVFDVLIGTWDATSHDWLFLSSTVYKAIDHRTITTYPGAGSRGLGQWRKSNSYGQILEVVDLDCTSPGTGTY